MYIVRISGIESILMTTESRRKAELAARRALKSSDALCAFALLVMGERLYCLATLYRWHTTRTGRRVIIRETPQNEANPPRDGRSA